VVAMAADAGADEAAASNAAIVASELTTNIVRHAGRGEIVLRPAGDDAEAALEILALDRGPGMRDIHKCMVDGYSTAGTAGNGLGAVKRLAQAFDLYSDDGQGTVAFASMACRKPAPRRQHFISSVVSLPVRGEQLCGDGWRIAAVDGRFAAIVVDGLGHGPLAAEAARAALSAFDDSPLAEPSEIVACAHRRSTATRGAALSTARLSVSGGDLDYAGVGNISGTLIADGASRGLFSQNGIVGARLPSLKQTGYPVAERALLILHSDGLKSRWKLSDYPGLSGCHPGVIAGVLYRDFNRGNDDVTVLVASLWPTLQ
jgi:anti-sigma regulatory factor (Ser/Thr protein kinase)